MATAPECPAPGKDELAEHQRTLGLVLFAVSSAYLPLTLALWFWRRKKFALVKRKGKLVALVALGVYMQVIMTCWVNWQGQYSLPCDVHVWLMFLAVPLAAGPLVVRLVLFFASHRFNEQLVAEELFQSAAVSMRGRFRKRSFVTEVRALVATNLGGRGSFAKVAEQGVVKKNSIAEHSSSSSASATASGGAYTAMLSLHAQKSFWFASAIMGLFFVLALASITYAYAIPGSPLGGKGCTGCQMGLQEAVAISIVLAVAVVPSAVLVFKLRRDQAADPLGIIRELKLAMVCGLGAIGGAALSVVDPGGLRATGQVDWMYVTTLSALALHTVICLGPVVSTFRGGAPDLDKYTLEDVLANNTAKLTFAQYLASELSVENLHFYDAVTHYKQAHGDIGVAECLDLAEEIVLAFIVAGGLLEINVGHSVRREILAGLQAARVGYVKPPLDLFDSAQRSVKQLMEEDSFPRFRRSPLYTDKASLDVAVSTHQSTVSTHQSTVSTQPSIASQSPL